MINKILMTVQGQKKLLKELNFLKKIKRPKIILSIAIARSHGDLKENAEYHAAKEEQSFCEGRIREIEFKLSNANVIDIKNLSTFKKIFFGATVTVLHVLSKNIYTYKIVGDDESNFKKQMISINSPIARSLIGKKKNDFLKVHTPSGKVTYKVLKIEYI
ncbi:Transcription elongation factor GreA [Buchnera aphidicola (Chaitophorus sp. 3695)]|uniref:transcription elongation factor GreA n=1 Tax=Buchnera aphidicola TaxID=9 RepID=UPI003463D035